MKSFLYGIMCIDFLIIGWVNVTLWVGTIKRKLTLFYLLNIQKWRSNINHKNIIKNVNVIFNLNWLSNWYYFNIFLNKCFFHFIKYSLRTSGSRELAPPPFNGRRHNYAFIAPNAKFPFLFFLAPYARDLL